MRVLVAIAWPGEQEVIEVTLAEGATVADALAAAKLGQRVDLAAFRTGVWSKPCGSDAPLREGDRVELYRALVADPKQVRRARARAAPKRR